MAETEKTAVEQSTEQTVETTERTFTQSELNTILSDRLKKERSKYADYEALKEKAAKFDAAQESGQSELDKANEKAASLQKQLDALIKANTLREMRQKVSAETGVPVELINGDTEEACTAQAQAILKFSRPNKYPSVPDGGEVQHNLTGSNAQIFGEWINQVMK